VGTLGGNLCFADPHSDPASLLLVADARVTLGAGDGRRTLSLGEFLVGPWQTALEPGELLLSIEVPALPAGSAIAHQRFHTHERPTATVSCLARVADGRIAEARVAVGSVGPRPVRSAVAEGLVTGLAVAELDPAILRQAGEAAAEVAEPDTDSVGSAEYKADLVAVLVERAVRDAAARATAAAA
jgi:carbon-monoxide dehydrogenase medium subunit